VRVSFIVTPKLLEAGHMAATAPGGRWRAASENPFGSRRVCCCRNVATVPTLRERRAKVRRNGKAGHSGRDDSV